MEKAAGGAKAAIVMVRGGRDCGLGRDDDDDDDDGDNDDDDGSHDGYTMFTIKY